MRSSLTTQTLLDGVKNCAVKITGVDVSYTCWVVVVDLDRFKNPRPTRVKIDHVEWAVTAGLEVLLAWHVQDGERELVLPLGSRGSMSFSDYGGLSNQGEDRSGNLEIMVQTLPAYNQTRFEGFSLFIDLIKQER